MKKILIVMIGILLLSNLSFGQTKFTPHVKGDGAMLFEFSGLGFLFADSYRGGFGYKKFLTPKTAVRGALSFHNSNETTTDFVPTGYVGADGFDKEFGVGLEVAGEMHKNMGKVDPYYGAGVDFSMTRTKFADPTSAPQGSTPTQTEYKNIFGDGAATTFGAFALLGVEYAINSMLSLAVEYHLGFSSSSQPDMTVIDPSGTETVIEGGKYSYFGITSVGILTLAIYLN